MSRRIGVTIGAMLLLTVQACETPQPGTPMVGGSVASTITAPPAAPALPGDTREKTRVTPRAAPAPSLSAADRDPDRLLRMDRRALATLLGKPQFVRREADARVWQYRSASCVLDVFLYDVASTHQVIHYEFRPATTLSGPTPGCFEALLTRVANVASS